MRRLWVPPAQRQTHICRMPVSEDDICGQVFGSDMELARHLKKCISANEAAMHAARLESRIPVLEHPDPELERHMREVGRRMLREGRWKVHKSERAGF